MLQMNWNPTDDYTRQQQWDEPSRNIVPIDIHDPRPRPTTWTTLASRDWNGSGQAGTGWNGAASGWNGSGWNGHGWGGGLQ